MVDHPLPDHQVPSIMDGDLRGSHLIELFSSFSMPCIPWITSKVRGLPWALMVGIPDGGL